MAPKPLFLLERAVAALQQGDAAAARTVLDQVLARDDRQPDALRLLGTVERDAGNASAAETLWRRSLAVQPRQPDLLNNLGNLLLRQGLEADAVECLQQALDCEPDHVQAAYNLARALHRLGRFDDAASALARALPLPGGPRASMLQLRAILEQQADRLHDALHTLDEALALAPASGALHHNRAVLLQRLERPQEALASHERARALGADDAHARYNRGNTLQSLGRAQAALDAYRSALQAEPRHGLALYDLARLRWRLGEADFDAELRALEAADPASALAPGLRGHLLLRASRPAEAAHAFRTALAREDAAGFHDGLARALSLQGRHEDALALHARAVAAAPGNVELRVNQAASQLAARHFAQARDCAADAHERAPAHQMAIAVMVSALRALGDPRADAWEDTERLVHVVDLEPPAGFADMEDFHAQLARELAPLHRDRREPLDQTLRRGTQTLGNLFDQGHPLVDALRQRIAGAVDSYVRGLPADAPAAWLGRRGSASAAWRFAASWSSRLGRGGFHTNHVHPQGWISSAYYVQVPPAVADPRLQAGWIQFGQPDVDAGIVPRRTVQPRPGRLVLFPSYLWHGTTPFDDADARLTIAFDVVPA